LILITGQVDRGEEIAMTVTAEELERARTGGSNLGWVVGLAVGIGGLVTVMSTGAGFSVSDDLPVATMVDKLDAARGSLLVGGGIQALVAMGLVVYAAFIRQSLLRREPDGALTPTIAYGGTLLAAAMTGIGAAATQLASYEGAVDPSVPLTLHTLEENLFAGAWCAIAVVAGAVAFASLRRGSVARWFGGVSAFVAILLVVAQVVVPWAGWFPAALWVAISSLGLRGDGS
jgi:hypothetical protein